MGTWVYIEEMKERNEKRMSRNESRIYEMHRAAQRDGIWIKARGGSTKRELAEEPSDTNETYLAYGHNERMSVSKKQ